jgi:hypothetical protein
MQRQPINVVAEVGVVVLAKVRFIKSRGFGKGMIELALIYLARVSETVLERACSASRW